MEYEDLYDESPYAYKAVPRQGGMMSSIRATLLICATILASVFGITFYGYQQDQFVVSSNANYVAIFDKKFKTLNICDKGTCTLVAPHLDDHPAMFQGMGPQGPVPPQAPLPPQGPMGPNGQRLLGTFPQPQPMGNPQMMNPQMMQQGGMMPPQMPPNPQMMQQGMMPQQMPPNPQMVQMMQQRGMAPQQGMAPQPINPQMMRGAPQPIQAQAIGGAPVAQAANNATPAAAQADAPSGDDAASDTTDADAAPADNAANSTPADANATATDTNAADSSAADSNTASDEGAAPASEEATEEPAPV